MKYKCLIFDCDGVLVDSELITARVLVSMAGNLGLRIDIDFVLNKYMGKSFDDIAMHLQRLSNTVLPADFEAEYRKNTLKAFSNELQPVEGIHSLLQQLKVPYCVASSGPLEKIHHTLTLTGLIDKFQDRIFSCYDIQSWKPDPDIFLYAAEQMGHAPEECAVIEDSVVGVQAALAGGFDVYMYSRSNNGHPDDCQNTMVFQNMKDLPKLLSL